jgi:hypothetical protein
MKRCALCHGKLGLGVRYRNLWNGRWVGSHSVLFGSLRGAIQRQRQHQTSLVHHPLPQRFTELRNSRVNSPITGDLGLVITVAALSVLCVGRSP